MTQKKIILKKDGNPFLLSSFNPNYEFDLDKNELLIKDEIIEILIFYFFPAAVIESTTIESKGGFTRYTLVKCLFDKITDLYNRIDNRDIGIFEIKFKDLIIEYVNYAPDLKRLNVSIASIED